MLTEGSDYSVDYSAGEVTILNQSIVDAGTAVNVSLESNSDYGMQRKTMIGVNWEYEFSRSLQIGGTLQHLWEQPLTTKVSMGSEPLRNTLWGVNINWKTESQWLTNLLNRRGFLPLVEGIMKEDQANHFCIAFCDIDNFKRINDSYGHDCGDEVLRHITKLIKREMQGCDICRWGGEEIIILMKDDDLTVAKEKMEYVRKCIEANPTIFFNKRIPATITIGLEEYKDIYHEPEEIIKTADERMYYGKQHGKNILIFQDMN